MRRPPASVLVVSILFLIVWSAPSYGQKQFNTWYFGNDVGLDFNTAPPTVLHGGGLFTNEGSAAVSDPETGEILFYTEGMTLFNREFRAMPNGYDLPSHPSSTQAALITRDPSDPDRYYVFTTGYYPLGFIPSGISYCIVDMNSDNGLGDVVEKNILLLDETAEKLTAIGSTDDSFYWIIGQQMNSNRYHAWKLTEAGLDRNAVVSEVGVQLGTSHTEAIGWLTASPDGKILAAANLAHNHVELFKFDFTTGLLSDPITLSGMPGAYGVAFSQDGSKLYCGADVFVYQFDISSYDAAKIRDSRQERQHLSDAGVSVRLAPDSNIYVRIGRINIGQFLGAITNTNSRSFIFEPHAFDLGPGLSALGLPNDPVLITQKPRILSASLTTLDFSPLNLCEERDSIVTLTNTGEVPVLITNAIIDRNFRIVNLVLPVTLEPGEKLDIHVETIADPVNRPAVLTVHYR